MDRAKLHRKRQAISQPTAVSNRLLVRVESGQLTGLTYIKDDAQNDDEQCVVANSDGRFTCSQSWTIRTAAVVASEIFNFAIAKKAASIGDVVANAAASTRLPFAFVAVFTTQSVGSSLEANWAAIISREAWRH